MAGGYIHIYICDVWQTPASYMYVYTYEVHVLRVFVRGSMRCIFTMHH